MQFSGFECITEMKKIMKKQKFEMIQKIYRARHIAELRKCIALT
jgi:hypothetical protein